MHVHGDTARTEEDFLPGLGLRILTRLYDPVVRVLGVHRAHAPLLDQAVVAPGDRVLEIGCGTANLALAAKRRWRSAEVLGLDPDPTMLDRARRKARRLGLPLELTRGVAEDLPYPDASVDVVLSAFMFHHLRAESRPRALSEVRRVLKPGGALHLVDFGGARDDADGWFARRMQRNDLLRDNFDGRVVELMTAAGLAEATETAHQVRWFGRITFYRAIRPDGRAAATARTATSRSSGPTK